MKNYRSALLALVLALFASSCAHPFPFRQPPGLKQAYRHATERNNSYRTGFNAGMAYHERIDQLNQKTNEQRKRQSTTAERSASHTTPGQ